jgi:16S rRNA processing protein RimM
MSWKSSKADPARDLPSTVVVAEVRRPHGLKGEVVVTPLSDVPHRLQEGSEVCLVLATGERRSVSVETARVHQGSLLVRFSGSESRDDAEEQRNARLEIPRISVPPPPEGSYYYFELLDCSCSDRRQGYVGKVVEIVEDGGGLILRVDDGRRQLLVPFVRAYLTKVDTAAGIIEVDLPEGLLETCASPS